MFRKIGRAVFGVSLVMWALTTMVTLVGTAMAHTGSPSPTTWANGNNLTAQALNDTIAHLHNTLSGGIVDSHISGTAAISHTKLATPALVAKAVLSTSTPCAGAGAAGTDCTVGVEHSKFLPTNGGAGSGNSALEATGTTGGYQLTLGYTPTNTNFIVNVTAGTFRYACAVTGRATVAPHITLRCEQDDNTFAADTNIMVTVFDTD